MSGDRAHLGLCPARAGDEGDRLRGRGMAETPLLLRGDCLELIKDIPDGSVDMVLCDLPYGTTDCAWDKVLPLIPLWKEYRRVAKKNAAIVLFAAQLFTTDLIESNRKMFRYDLVWRKNRAVGFLNANRMPLRAHESILLFYRKLPVYHPQKTPGKPYVSTSEHKTQIYRNHKRTATINTGDRHPQSVLDFSLDQNHEHPTVKPVALLEYLIRTYSDEGETVLDNCMGSGSTGVACINTGRRFIGMELDPGYFETAKRRVKEAQERVDLEARQSRMEGFE